LYWFIQSILTVESIDLLSNVEVTVAEVRDSNTNKQWTTTLHKLRVIG